MKRIFEALLLAAIVVIPTAGICQTRDSAKPKIGFVRIINAVAPGTGNVKFLIDGKNLFEKGYEFGQATGGMGFAAGTRTLTVKREGLKDCVSPVPLVDGETMSLIAFAEKLPPVKEGGPPRWIMKVLRLKQQKPKKGNLVSVVSVCAAKETAVKLVKTGADDESRLDATGLHALAERYRVTPINPGNGRNTWSVFIGGNKTPATSFFMKERGNYVVILFESTDSATKALSFYDPKFVVAD